MPISPPSDIVLDALMAADPAKRAARITQFEKLSPAEVVRNGSKIQAGQAVTAKLQPVGLQFDAFTNVVARQNMEVLAHPAAGPPRPAFKQFEAMVLQNFVSSILPSEGSKTFGRGTSGAVTKSWMAEAISNQIAQGQGIGIAEALGARYQSEAAVQAPINEESPVNHAGGENVSKSDWGSSPIAAFFQTLQEVFLDLFDGDSGPRPTVHREASSR